MTRRVYIARTEDVPDLVPALLPWLQKMALWTRGRRSVEDIIKRVLLLETNLWVTLDAQGQPNGALVTKVEIYPRMRMLHVLHCAGDRGHMEDVADEVYASLDAFAKFTHCGGVEFIGRPGWEKHVKDRGYEVKSVTYQRFFDQDSQTVHPK